jgi:hypothetical protein
MIIQKTIFTIVGCSFIFYTSAQIKSSEILSGGSFQKTDSLGIFQNKISKKHLVDDSIARKTQQLKTLNEKNIFISAASSLKKSTEKHLAELTKKIKAETGKQLSPSFKLKQGEVFYTGVSDTSYRYSNPYYQGNFEMSSEWTVASIPVVVSLQNQYYSDNGDYLNDNFVFRFDKDAYLQQVKKQMGSRFDPSALVKDMRDPAELLRTQATGLLKTDLDAISKQYSGVLDKDIESLTGSVAGVFSVDTRQLRQKYFNAKSVAEVEQHEKILSSLRHKANLGEKVDEQQLASLTQSIVRQKALQEFVRKIDEHKSRWESSGVLKKIKEFDLLKKNRIAALFNDPSTIRKKAKEILSLNGLQKLFLNINRLNIGRDALSLSPMSFNHFLHSGVSTEFVNNKGNTVMLVAGRQKDFNSPVDYGFEGNLFSNNSQVKAARLGLGASKVSSSHIGVSSFRQSLGGASGLSFNPNDFREVLVTTLSNELKMGERGSISIDLSRSATAYSNNRDGVKPQSSLSRILGADNFMSNTAIAIKYADENIEKGLSYQFSFNKAANGYSNPGNSFLNSGSTEVGTQVRKSLLKNKMQLSFRGNVRDYKFNDELDRHWRNVYMVADVKWRMKKGQYFSLRYQPNRMTRIEEGKRSVVSSMHRLSIESSLYKKIAKIGYRNYLSLAYQDNNYTLSPSENISNTSLQLNSFQNITLGKNLVFVNLVYNRSLDPSTYVYFNTSLNVDAGYSFMLWKKIMVSPGIVYASVNEWYRQIGVRQSVSGQINDKFSVSVYVDARKNLVVKQVMWDSPVRADFSIRYLFKK